MVGLRILIKITWKSNYASSPTSRISGSGAVFLCAFFLPPFLGDFALFFFIVGFNYAQVDSCLILSGDLDVRIVLWGEREEIFC